MRPDDARQVLLRQHARLRELLAVVDARVDRIARGEAALPELEVAVGTLRRAFHEHNATEERLLVPILEGDPAWGPARISRMIEEHREEHRLLREHLAAPMTALLDAIADVTEEISAHMDAEERTFLSPGVLRAAPQDG